MIVRQQCDECKQVLYDFVDGIVVIGKHKPTCSKLLKKDEAYFSVGEKVRRKKMYQNVYWSRGDEVFTVAHCGPKSPEFFIIDKDEWNSTDLNVHEWKRFERV